MEVLPTETTDPSGQSSSSREQLGTCWKGRQLLAAVHSSTTCLLARGAPGHLGLAGDPPLRVLQANLVSDSIWGVCGDWRGRGSVN